MNHLMEEYQMQRYFQYHSKLSSFQVFSGYHLSTIGVVLFLCFILFIFRKKLQQKQIFFRLSLALFLVIVIFLHYLWLMEEKALSAKSELPLQLSDLAVIFAVIMLLSKSKKLFDFMYFAGIASSIQAIMTPDLGRFSFPHFQYFLFFFLHGGVVWACLFMVIVLKHYPTFRSMWMTILLVNLYAAFIYLLNKKIGSNYLYIMKKPRNASVLDYLGSWPTYLFSMELLMILSFYILYCPFWMKKLKSSA